MPDPVFVDGPAPAGLPSPGSPLAVRNGCTCPVLLDGVMAPDAHAADNWTILVGCPMHHPEPLEGDKFDDGKPRWDLLPALAAEEIVEVLTFGAAKYGEHNFRQGLAYGRLFAACQRHLWAWLRGEEVDPESGLPHLAHAATNLLMIRDLQHYAGGEDDRWRPS